MIETAPLRELVERWIADEFEHREDAFHRLAATSGLTADAWRRRLSDDPGRGWWSFAAIDEADADELLTAMGRPDLVVAGAAGPRVSAKVRLPGESRRIKRLSRAALLTREQVFAVHKLHIDGGLSMREIARRGWQRWGYASERSCLNSIIDLLDSFGLRRRDRIEATILASTTHGRGSRANKAAYKRWHRRAFGAWPSDTRGGGKVHKRPGEQVGRHCAGVRQNYPGRGQPCRRYALHDSDFCFNHDPRNVEPLRAHLAAARELLPKAA